MKSSEALSIIDKMKKDLTKSGIVTETIVEDLKNLRPFAITEEDPSLTKVIRLAYEHITENGSFNIRIPEEIEEVEETELEETLVEEEPEEEPEVVEMDFEEKRESLDYLLSIMTNCDENKMNREDLIGYRNALMEY
ncbi:MAG: hypothetical protein ACI9J3_003366 [Parvicellaceae bacterium]|jgi:hypothetical protein